MTGVKTTREGQASARNQQGGSGPDGSVTADGSVRSERRAHLVVLAGELFAQKGYRATTVREIADAAGILSGSLYHHFDSKESIGDEILSSFINEVLADYRGAVASAQSPRAAIEQIVRSTSRTLPGTGPPSRCCRTTGATSPPTPGSPTCPRPCARSSGPGSRSWRLGQESGLFRADLDSKLTYRLLRDVLWIPEQWRRTRGYSTDQVVDAFLRILFDGIANRA